MTRPASGGASRRRPAWPSGAWPRGAAVILAALVGGAVLAGCSVDAAPTASSGTVPPTEPGAVELTVFAAASLRDVFEALGEAYEATHPTVRVRFSFDASSALRAQLEAGAVADVFASADESNPSRLVAAGLTAGPARAFAGNGLAIVTPADDPAGIADPFDLARPGVRVVAAGPDVPITRYAEQLIATLQAVRGAPADLPAAIARNTASREDNVRAVLAKIELGEGDAGIVYATDARGNPKVRVVPLPPGVDVRVTYAAVAPSSAPHPSEAAGLLDWLGGPAARAILGEYGFLPPP